jgi:histidinol-phosphate/aromatic aminotransferase/cobyric acid decarboxylase-like protein
VETLQAYSAPLEGRRGLLRLDFNENTIGPSPKVVEAIHAIAADQLAVYPEYEGLREAVVANLADRSAGRPGLAHPLEPSQVGLFNGVDAAIHALFHAYGSRGDTLLTTSHTFGYYSPCALMQGMEIAAIPYHLPDFAFPLEAIRAALVGAAAQDEPVATVSVGASALASSRSPATNRHTDPPSSRHSASRTSAPTSSWIMSRSAAQMPRSCSARSG